ncbi:two-partner secretion domain-containing protein, partial [Hydrogenophaga palleronii]|uniref:two-partner secretion domain-containing protein n=1 Tax=Hydrogenophaga palleronii TaxID=65655 RepID=UPI0009FC4A0C
MNRTYRLVWNELSRCWVAVAEHVSTRGKRSAGTVALATATLMSGTAFAQTAPAPHALPSGGQTVAGQTDISSSGSTMTIDQSSARAAIDWQSFNVGRDAHVRFVQPDANAVALNRVQGPDASQIFGRVTANGQVFLSNPNGVYFAPGASVDVGGLVATTHRISLDDFMAGRSRFERQGATGSVVNAGELRAALGGYIALLAPEVRNQGLVVANLGTVALAAGEAFELQFDANNTLAGLRVEASTIRSLVDNRSAVLAPGGLVILSAQALDRVQGGVVRNSGRIEATGLAQRGGRIVLEASDQIVQSGHISASATAQGPAGSVRLQAPEVLNTGHIEARGSDEHLAGGTVEIVAGQVRQSETGRIDVSAPGQGGVVRVRASEGVALSGAVLATATGVPAPVAAPAVPSSVDGTPGQGGEITVQAAQITLASASLDASGERDGGRIVLDASAPVPAAPPAPQPLPVPEPGKVAIQGSTQLSSRGRRGHGGSVTLLGDTLDLQDNTRVDATGAVGGGQVRVGGGWQGGEGLHQAHTVNMSADASIDASALVQGDGGSVVLWSDVNRTDGLTTAAGRIRARGGAQGGDGGRIETSGHHVDTERVAVDAGAAPGQGGTGGLWLIDPTDSVITQAVADGYAATLNTGTSVLNEVIGSITWSSNVTLNTTAGGAGSRVTLTLRSANSVGASPITLNNASISATGGALNLVLWSSYNTGGQAGPVRITGSTINTNGGHVWVGGGETAATAWNGLTVGAGAARTWTANEQGVQVSGSSITTGAGSIRLSGSSHVSGGNLNGTSNMGVWLDTGTTLRTTSGSLDIEGDIRGTYATGTGLRVGGFGTEGDVTLESGAGSMALTGTLSGTPATWGHGLFLDSTTVAGNRVTVRSGSGAITLRGERSGSGATDSSGLQLHGGTNSNRLNVVSGSGNITLRGVHENAGSAPTANGIRFTASNVLNSIRIGDDGSGTYSGNILVEANSLMQRQNHAGAGSISMQSRGTLTFQPYGTSFTHLRAGDSGTLTFDDDWNFGSTLSGFTLGKVGNNANMTLSNGLSVAGAIRLYGGQITLNGDLTSSATGDIFIKSLSSANPSIQVNGNIRKTGGGRSTLTLQGQGRVLLVGSIQASGTALDTVLWSDYDNSKNDGGVTLATGSSISTNGGHLWAGGSSSNGGSTTWNGLTVGNGASIGNTGYNNNALDLYGSVNTAGGDVLLWAGNGVSTVHGIRTNNTGSIQAGSGNVTLIADGTWDTLPITTTGVLSLVPHEGSYGGPINWVGSVSGGHLNLTSAYNGMQIRNVANLGGFSLGRYSGMGALVADNTSDVTISSALSIAGSIAIRGGGVTINRALSAGGDITLTATDVNADLLINASITSTAATTSSLLAQSARHVSVGGTADLTATQAAMNTQLWADTDRSGDGIVRVQARSINTRGGTLRFGNNETALINGVSTLVGGDVFFNGSAAQTIATGGGQFDLYGETILANPAGLTINTGGGNARFHGVLNSGNTYSFVDKTDSGGTGTWTEARTEARNGTTGGAAVGDSYLATITSRLENSVAGLAAGYRGAWIGAHRADPTQSFVWTWADGPEAGQQFMTQATSGGGGTSVDGRYNNFGAGEPNGTLAGNESVAQFYGNAGRWNDLSRTTTYTATEVSVYSVLGFVRETNLANSPLSILAGSGQVRIDGGVGGNKALASLNVQAASTTVNGNALITSGAQNYSGSLSAISAGDLQVSATAVSLSGAGHAALLQAAGNVSLSNGINFTTNNGNLTLWSDTDGTNGGAIAIGDNSTINTANGATSQQSGGGHITLGGGTNITTGFAQGSTAAGVAIGTGAGSNTTMVSGGGDITLRGRSSSTDGVRLGRMQVDAGQGAIAITGEGTGGCGVEFSSGSTQLSRLASARASGTAIAIRGSSTTSHGVVFDNVAAEELLATGGGGIDITGTRGPSGYGVWLQGTRVLASSGAIAINGGAGGIHTEASSALGAVAGHSAVSTSSSAITLTGDRFSSTANTAVTTAGALTVQPFGASFSSALTWPLANYTLAPGLTGLTLGKSGNTADITIASAQTVAGPITLYGGNLAINAALVASGGGTITLNATGTVIDGASGYLQAGALLLRGGNVTLDHASNNVGTLAASGVGALTYLDADALDIGNVDGVNGLSASGVVNIGTRTGDLTLRQSVATSNATASALTLNAGMAAAAGTASGGNLVVNGAAGVQVGAGGTAGLYSGAIAGSTGLGTLVGLGSGRFRYGSDENVSAYSLALGSGLNAIYREQPTVSRSVVSQTLVYGDTYTASFTLGGGQNGDTLTQAFAAAPTVTVGGSISGAGHATVGTHALSASGGSTASQLGYAVNSTITGGTLNVTPRALQVNYTGANKVYDGNAVADVSASDDRVSGDAVVVNWGSASFADKNVGTGKAVALSGVTLTGTDAANYSVAASGTTSADITARALTVNYTGTDKVYDGNAVASVSASDDRVSGDA